MVAGEMSACRCAGLQNEVDVRPLRTPARAAAGRRRLEAHARQHTTREWDQGNTGKRTVLNCPLLHVHRCRARPCLARGVFVAATSRREVVCNTERRECSGRRCGMAGYQLTDEGSMLRFAQHRLTPLQCARIQTRTAGALLPTGDVHVRGDAHTRTI